MPLEGGTGSRIEAPRTTTTKGSSERAANGIPTERSIERLDAATRTTVTATVVLPTPTPTDLRNQRGSPFGKRVKSSLLRMEGSDAAGLLLLGFALQPLYVNPEALEILVYPGTAEAVTEPDRFFDQKIRSVLLVDGTCPESGFVPEFRSGRRRYVCRAFFLNAKRPKSPDAPVLALLFERRNHIGFDASRVAGRFRLTPREQETLKYVMHGLTNKEIANQMNISPNTVKAFLKLIMTKMGVSTRSAIIGKAIAA